MAAPALPAPDANLRRVAAAIGDSRITAWFRAPGRVNLMGDHTDYHEGFVLPAAVDRECVIALATSQDGRIRAHSLDVDPEDALADLAADGSDEPHAVTPEWGRYVAGVARALAELGRPAVGIEATLASSVPRGAGLSSSAALEVACALALCDAAGFTPTAEELALACQRGEHLATGVPSGIMDQLASLHGRDGSALLIDCRSLDVREVRLPHGLALLVVDSGVPRTLAGTAYAERRAASEAIAARLGLRSLRDATLDDVADEPLARHVVSENERVHATGRALADGDLDALGALFAASHASLRDDYRVSTPELDALVEALVAAGAHGARLTGAGFGGSVVAVVSAERAGAVAEEATARYREATGRQPTPFVCRAVSGAERFQPTRELHAAVG